MSSYLPFDQERPSEAAHRNAVTQQYFALYHFTCNANIVEDYIYTTHVHTI